MSHRLATPPRLVATALCCVMSGSAVEAAAAVEQKRSYNLPSGDAATTLNQFAGASGQQIIFMMEKVKGERTNAVAGDYAAPDALARMLAGTGLNATRDPATGAFVVSRKRAAETAPRQGEVGPVSDPEPKPMTTSAQPRPFLSRLVAMLVASTAADAQTAAPSPMESAVILSPFTVTSEKDRGYAATSTLSGTRLNTSLRDTAAAVSVITPEFLEDLGLNNANEIANFMVSSERSPGAGAGANFNSEQNSASSIRVRGLGTGGSQQANFFAIPWTIDSYAIERITQTRGPNSLLFGIGNSAGSLSATTKRASLTQKTIAARASLAVDSEDSRRTDLDVSTPVLADRFSLRFAAIDERRRGYLDYDRRDERRLFLTGTLKLFDFPNYRATVRTNGEWARADRNLPDLTTPNDNISAWIAAGRPTVAGTASAGSAANLPVGTARAAAAARLTFIDGSPTAVPALNWLNTARGSSTTAPGNTAALLRFGPDAPVPLDRNYRGPANASNFTGRSLQFFLEQTFFRDFAVELASSRTDWDLFWVRSTIPVLSVDVNRNLPNGQPNPNVGRIYGEDIYRVQDEIRTDAEDRATVAYLFDGQRHSPWLGTWVFSGLVNRSENQQGLDDSFEVNTTPLPGFNASVSNAQNRIVRRTYLFSGADVWLPSATFGRDLPALSAPGVTPALRNTRAANDRTENSGWTLGTQAKLLRDHLVLTYGHRHDHAERYSATPPANPDGFFSHWRTYASPLAIDLSSETQTFGAVAHLQPWVSAFYNQSESIDLAAPRRDLFGVGLPVPVGTGQDYGLKIALLSNRLNATLSRFDSGTLNQQNNPASGLPDNVGLIEDATGRSINLVNRGEQPPDTFDTVARGYEFELTYNPVDAWRIVANATKLDAVSTNVNLRLKRFLEERVFPLEATFGRTVTAGGQTVSTLIAQMRNQLATFHTAREGASAPELRQWSANLISSYALTRGALRGVSFGGYAQYRGPNVLALGVDSAGNAMPSRRIMGDSEFTLGAHLRYERRIGLKARWSVQLNVFNALDADTLLRKAADPVTGTATAWGYRQPRTFRLANTVSF